MISQIEQQLENEPIKQLIQNGYEHTVIPGVDELNSGFRKQMNQLNKDNLKGNVLSDKEFQRLPLLIEGKSVFESAKILRDKQVLTRDDGSKIYILFFNTQKWDANHFQVMK